MGSPSRRTYLLDRTDACKDHNILSDRERDSEYLQIPMLTFQQRLVLESVKCREDMKFGAANTALRLRGQAWLIADCGSGGIRQRTTGSSRKSTRLMIPTDTISISSGGRLKGARHRAGSQLRHVRRDLAGLGQPDLIAMRQGYAAWRA